MSLLAPDMRYCASYFRCDGTNAVSVQRSSSISLFVIHVPVCTVRAVVEVLQVPTDVCYVDRRVHYIDSIACYVDSRVHYIGSIACYVTLTAVSIILTILTVLPVMLTAESIILTALPVMLH